MKRDFYRIYIACALRQQAHGRASTRTVRERLDRAMQPLLSNSDRQQVRSGGVRWWVDVRWARDQMVRAGLLKNNSPRGIWELTGKGRRYADEVLSQLEAKAKRG